MKESKNTASSVLVFVVTAKGDEEVAVEAFRSNGRTHLKKPFVKNIPLQPGVSARSEKAPSPLALSQHQKIQRAVRFIKDNYRTGIRLDDVAREAGMSPAHFSRTFKKTMGLPYQDYLNDRRIAMAKNLLRSNALSVAEIAASLGFADATGFGRIFKKLTGRTPSTYRNLSRG